MRYSVPGFVAALGVGTALLASPAAAHHPILAKFDENAPVSLSGTVTAVYWKNPHVHVFLDVEENGQTVNWAVELPDVNDLMRNGWTEHSVQPGDSLEVSGIAARDGSPQVWGEQLVNDAGRPVFTVAESEPYRPLVSRPLPRWEDGQPRMGEIPGGPDGYWAFPTSTALVEDGVDVEFVANSPGLLRNIDDASNVAPMQPWAEQLYRFRQSRYLQDDPLFLNCKPPGGPRQFQLPQGVEFVEERNTDRVFVLIGGGNRNFRMLYTDGRSPEDVSQVGGSDDNPLYYGRSGGSWEGDTLVIETAGFNEDFWFTNGGLPHTEHLRLTERFTRVDHDTMQYEVTIDDPGAYTRPWTVSWEMYWVAGEPLPYHLCQDNRP